MTERIRLASSCRTCWPAGFDCLGPASNEMTSRLGKIGAAGRRTPQVMKRGLSRVEKLGLRRYSGRKWTDHFLPGIVQIVGRDLTLPRQNLPQSDIGLKNAQRVGAQGDI